MLWGSRSPEQAQASLRRELSNIRIALNRGDRPLLHSEHGRVTLDLERIALDWGQEEDAGQFLEGLDLAGEEGFEDWLREQRQKRFRGVEEAPETPRANPPPSSGDSFLRQSAIAVLPFSNLTGDTRLDYLVEGIAEDLIDYLSRQRWIPIIARTTSFSYSSETKTLQEIGQELGARYIVEGRLRGGDGRLGLAATISDAGGGRVLWSRRTDLSADSLAEINTLLTELAGGLCAQFDNAEMIRAVAQPEADLAVSDLLWRARWHHNQYTRADSIIAEELFEQALAKAPHAPEAIIQYGLFKQRQIWLHRGSREEIQDLRRLAHRAISADYTDGRGYMLAGIADLWMRDAPQAIRLFEQAISLNPSLAYAYGQLGAAHYLSGAPDLALAALNRALRLDVGEIYGFYIQTEIAIAKAMLERWQEAIYAADCAISRRPAYWYAHIVKIHALMGAGNRRSAQAARRALLAACHFDASFIDWVPFVDRTWNARLKSSFAAADEKEGGQ